jgi:hypothetical protein
MRVHGMSALSVLGLLAGVGCSSHRGQEVRSALVPADRPEQDAASTKPFVNRTAVSVVAPLCITEISLVIERGDEWIPRAVEGSSVCPTRTIQFDDHFSGETSEGSTRKLTHATGSGMALGALGRDVPVLESAFSANWTSTGAATPDEPIITAPVPRPLPGHDQELLLGPIAIRDLLLPGGDHCLGRALVTGEPNGEMPDECLSQTFPIAQLEAICGTLLDKTLVTGTLAGNARLVGCRFTKPWVQGYEEVGASVAMDIVMKAELPLPCKELEDPYLLLLPFCIINIEKAWVTVHVKGTGRILLGDDMKDGSGIPHSMHYSGLYEVTMAIQADTRFSPLGYETPATLKCSLNGSMLCTVSRRRVGE